MNKKQLITVWSGIIAICLMGIYVPYRMAVLDHHAVYYDFIINLHLRAIDNGQIDYGRLLIQWVCVALLTFGFFITFRGRKK